MVTITLTEKQAHELAVTIESRIRGLKAVAGDARVSSHQQWLHERKVEELTKLLATVEEA